MVDPFGRCIRKMKVESNPDDKFMEIIWKRNPEDKTGRSNRKITSEDTIGRAKHFGMCARRAGRAPRAGRGARPARGAPPAPPRSHRRRLYQRSARFAFEFRVKCFPLGLKTLLGLFGKEHEEHNYDGKLGRSISNEEFGRHWGFLGVVGAGWGWLVLVGACWGLLGLVWVG